VYGKRRFGRESDLACDPSDSLDFRNRVGSLVPGDTVLAALFSVTEVWIRNQGKRISSP
jgi:hypothetical protein